MCSNTYMIRKEMKDIKKTQLGLLGMKNMISEMKKMLNKFNSRLGKVENLMHLNIQKYKLYKIREKSILKIEQKILKIEQ